MHRARALALVILTLLLVTPTVDAQLARYTVSLDVSNVPTRLTPIAEGAVVPMNVTLGCEAGSIHTPDTTVTVALEVLVNESAADWTRAVPDDESLDFTFQPGDCTAGAERQGGTQVRLDFLRRAPAFETVELVFLARVVDGPETNISRDVEVGPLLDAEVRFPAQAIPALSGKAFVVQGTVVNDGNTDVEIRAVHVTGDDDSDGPTVDVSPVVGQRAAASGFMFPGMAPNVTRDREFPLVLDVQARVAAEPQIQDEWRRVVLTLAVAGPETGPTGDDDNETEDKDSPGPGALVVALTCLALIGRLRRRGTGRSNVLSTRLL